MKKFVPFDDFEKDCSPKGKELAETMQENCNDRLKPDEPKPCSSVPCPPYWQPTGETRCLGNGLIDQEEKDGCGNTRWTRTVDVVVWEATGVTECDTPNNRIQIEQKNQCGDTRLLNTVELCCTPSWANVDGGEGTVIYNCDQSMLRVEQEDGCGHTRLRANGQAVVWVGTGEQRCQPGDIYEVEQQNQCGDTRWFNMGTGCPCIPDWTDEGSQRCTGEFVEQNQVDGCGGVRWHNTGTLVNWVDNGEQRCSPTGFIQTQQVSQCGTTRWFTTTDACVNSPPPNNIDPATMSFSYCNSSPNTTIVTLMLNAATKMIDWSRLGTVLGSQPWVAGAVNRADYEARITYVASEPMDADRTYSGSTLGTWFNLGDYTTVGGSFTAVSHTGPGTGTSGRRSWDFTEIRIDIRRVGYPIEGGVAIGPIRVVGGGDCD